MTSIVPRAVKNSLRAPETIPRRSRRHIDKEASGRCHSRRAATPAKATLPKPRGSFTLADLRRSQKGAAR